MKTGKILKCTALTMAVVMCFSTAAFARPHHHIHHCSGPAWYNTGWGAVAIGIGTGLIVSAIANSSRSERRKTEERRQDPGEYRQDPGEYRRPPAEYSTIQTKPVKPDGSVELAEKVPGGVMINGQFYAPVNETQPQSESEPYTGLSGQTEYPMLQDPGRY